jgi:hypothetical protein
MSLYASYVCLCVLALSRIPRLILRRQTPNFYGGSIIVGIRARLGLNTYSNNLKNATMLMVITLSPYKDNSKTLRWQVNCVYILQLRNCTNECML